jgi:multidrug efflux pump
LQRQIDDLVRKLQAQPGLIGVSTQFRSSTALRRDRLDQGLSLGVSQQDVTQTLGMYLGSLYVTNFNEFGRYWQVNLQAEGKESFRNGVILSCSR